MEKSDIFQEEQRSFVIDCKDQVDLYQFFQYSFPQFYQMMINSDLFLRDLEEGSLWERRFVSSGYFHHLYEYDPGCFGWQFWCGKLLSIYFFENGEVFIEDLGFREKFNTWEESKVKILERLIVLHS